MKQILLKMTLAIAGLLMSINVFAAGFTAENGLAYTILETGDGSNAVEVTYTNSKGGSYTGDIVVPAEVTNESVTYKVTGIGAKAFYKCTGMTSVVLPEGLKSIAKEAFYGCNAITTITIPSTVTEILSYAFYNCKALTAVVIPDGVEVINTYTFNNCIKMTSLTIGAGVKEINSSAFKYCESLPTVTIPKNVAKIAGDAFGSCKSLKEFVVDSENASYCAIDKILYSKDGTTAIMCPIALEGAITIPAGTTTIDVEAFSGCTKITSVTVPSSVTAINEGAFDGCSALTTANLSEGLLTIGESVFDNAGLTSIVVPNSVTSIGANAFYYCMALETAQIGSGVTTIGASPFYRCTALKSINVDAANANFTSVDGVLYSKDKTTLLAYPNKKAATYDIIDGVTTIGEYAFCYCTDVTAVTMPNTVTELKKEAFSNCEALATLNFSTALLSIGEKAFYYCEALKEATLPESLIFIGEMAFNKATSLTKVIIPNSVTTLDDKAFQNCSALTDISLGTGITEVGGSTFNGCSKVARINIFTTAVPKTGSGAFNKVPSSVVVTMPTASVEGYRGVTAWNNLIKNKPALAVVVEDTAKVYFSTGVETVTGVKHIIGDSTSLFIPSEDPLTITAELPKNFVAKYNDEVVTLDENNAYAIEAFEADATFAVVKEEVVKDAISVVATYPADGKTAVYTQRPPIRIEFNGVLNWDDSKYADIITVTDKDGKSYAGSLTHAVVRETSVLHFYLNEDLPLDKCFLVSVKGGVADLEGNETSDFSFRFLSEYRAKIEANTLFALNGDIETFWGPAGSGSTAGLTEEGNTFEGSALAYSKEANGSAKLTYSFDPSATNWQIREYTTTQSGVNANKSDIDYVVSFWCYGDGSNNGISAMLRINNSELKFSNPITAIDFRGWNLITWDLQNDSFQHFTGEATTMEQWRFDSFYLKHQNIDENDTTNPYQEWNGEIYLANVEYNKWDKNAKQTASIDDIKPDDPTAIEEICEDNAPAEYYNLQGVKVANPEKGIFIKKQGNKATKVVL